MCKRIKFWLCKLLYSHRKKSCCISFSSKGFKVITLYRIFELCFTIYAFRLYQHRQEIVKDAD